MANKGVAPADTGTTLGIFRVSVGDTEYVPLVPNEAGFGNYTYFSDAELQVILDSSDNSNASIASAYRKLAAILALKAISIGTDDLKYASEQRAEIMRKIANDYQSAANAGAGTLDIFELIPTVGNRQPAELAEWPYYQEWC